MFLFGEDLDIPRSVHLYYFIFFEISSISFDRMSCYFIGEPLDS